MLSLAVWMFAIWLVLTWTLTAEQLAFGAIFAMLLAVAMAPLGDVVAPWRLFDPRRSGALILLAVAALARIVRANISLARRILMPSRPLRSGMVIVPTSLSTDAAIGATGLITSLVVDNQIVDVDVEQRVLQYHAVAVPGGSKAAQAESINAPVERLLARIDRRNR